MVKEIEFAKVLLEHIEGLNGSKLDADGTAKHMGLSQVRMWAFISKLLRMGLIIEPGGHHSRVYYVVPSKKSLTQAFKEEAVRLGLPTVVTKATELTPREETAAWTKKNRERWGVEPRKHRKRGDVHLHPHWHGTSSQRATKIHPTPHEHLEAQPEFGWEHVHKHEHDTTGEGPRPSTK